MKIDSHQHFWKYDLTELDWMDKKMDIIQRDFLPPELKSQIDRLNFEGVIAVEARQKMEENDYLLNLANNYDFIKGIVGWLDLKSKDLNNYLCKYSKNTKFVGCRHILISENNSFMLDKKLLNGLQLLFEHNLTYDFLIKPSQLPLVLKIVDSLPDGMYVIDHIGNPEVEPELKDIWIKYMTLISKNKNVYCKLSGIVENTNWYKWKLNQFDEYLDIIFNLFGPERLMIGSNWPVCILSGSYIEVMSLVIQYINNNYKEHEKKILGQNCINFYKI